MRKTGSERLRNLPKDTQRAGERMRTRAQSLGTPSHFRMAYRLLLFRNTDLVWKEKRSLKCAGRKFQGCLGEKLRWAVLNRLLFHPHQEARPPVEHLPPSALHDLLHNVRSPLWQWRLFPDFSSSKRKDQTPRFQDSWTIVERVIDPWKCNFSRNICVLEMYLMSRGRIIWNNILADPERVLVAVAESCAQRRGWVKCSLFSSAKIPAWVCLAAFNLNCYCNNDNSSQ